MLQKSTVSINLANGIDQKDDDFTGEANTFEDLSDFVYDKDKRLAKRNGKPRLPTTVISTETNPLTIGVSSQASNTFSHKQELVMQNKGALYGFDETRDSWVQKGWYNPVSVEAKTRMSTDQSCVQTAQIVVGDRVFRVGVFESSTFDLRYSLESDTGEVIAFDQLIETGLIQTPRLVRFATGEVYLVYQESANIKIRSVNMTTGAVGVATTLKSNAVNDSYSQLDCVIASPTGVGERLYVIYRTLTDVVRVFAVLNTGALDGAIAEGTSTLVVLPTEICEGGFALYFSTTQQKLFGAWVQRSLFGGDYNEWRAVVTEWTCTSSGFTQVANYGSLGLYGDTGFYVPKITGLAFIERPDNAEMALLWADEKNLEFINSSDNDHAGDAVYYFKFQGTALTYPIMRGLRLISSPINDTERGTVYLPMAYKSRTQSTFYLLDLFRGKTESVADILGVVANRPWPRPIAQAFYRNLENELSGFFVSRSQVISNVLRLPVLVATRISGTDLFLNVLNQKGAGEILIDLKPSEAPSSEYFANNSLLTGGFLHNYDGVGAFEHNFLIQPEGVEVYESQSTGEAMVVAITDGTAGSPEITTFQFPPASLINPSGSTTNQFTIYQGANRYAVGFRVNGVGTLPSLGTGGRNYLVDITGNESADEVAIAVIRTLYDFGFATFFQITKLTANPGQVQFVRTANGNETNATINMINPFALDAGSYSYTYVYSWVDANGLQHRSAPARPTTINKASNTSVLGVTCYAPPVSLRGITELKIEIYRTLRNGSTFYRLQSLQFLESFSPSQVTIGLRDLALDTAIAAQELLYTTGGILPNFNPGPCSYLTKFKNRVVLVGPENQVYYSKVGQNNLPVEFSEELFVQTDNDGERVVSAHQLDDKLVIFREKSIIALAGDGANDLGVGVSFSQPVTVASDVGCQDPKSVVLIPTGLMFKSTMGIQGISRSLEVIYLGDRVKDFNQYTVAEAVVLKDDEKLRQAVFVLDGIDQALVYNYELGRWGVFTQSGGKSCCLWKGNFTSVDGSGLVQSENKTVWVDTGAAVAQYNPTFRTAWLKLKNLQDFARVYRTSFLGALRSPHNLVVKAYYDYDLSNFDSYSFSSSNIAGSEPQDLVYQAMIHMKRQKCQSIQLEVSLVATTGSQECASLTDMAFLVGIKQGLNKVKKGKRL